MIIFQNRKKKLNKSTTYKQARVTCCKQIEGSINFCLFVFFDQSFFRIIILFFGYYPIFVSLIKVNQLLA